MSRLLRVLGVKGAAVVTAKQYKVCIVPQINVAHMGVFSA